MTGPDLTRAWLDRRYQTVDKDGVYVAHQPVYGFRRGHCELGAMEKYIISHQILKAVASLKFNTLLDVGAGEGYTAALIRSLFGCQVSNCDLSPLAGRRAQELYGLSGAAAEADRLPFPDAQFDLVLCSETLEHLADPWRALRELLRLARRAVVLTVPDEPPEVIASNRQAGEPHAHIQRFEVASFSAQALGVSRVLVRRMLHRWLEIPAILVEAAPRTESRRFPRFALRLYTLCQPLLQRWTGRRAAARLLEWDERLSNPGGNRFLPQPSLQDMGMASSRLTRGLLFLILKDESCLAEKPQPISPYQVLDFRVPYLRLSPVP